MRKVVFRLTPSLRSFSRDSSVFQVDFISNNNKLGKNNIKGGFRIYQKPTGKLSGSLGDA